MCLCSVLEMYKYPFKNFQSTASSTVGSNPTWDNIWCDPQIDFLSPGVLCINLMHIFIGPHAAGFIHCSGVAFRKMILRTTRYLLIVYNIKLLTLPNNYQ